jgi:hypothetical protein
MIIRQVFESLSRDSATNFPRIVAVVHILELGLFLSTSVPVFVWGDIGEVACTLGLRRGHGAEAGQMVSAVAVGPVSRNIPGLGLSVLVLPLVSFCFSRTEKP